MDQENKQTISENETQKQEFEKNKNSENSQNLDINSESETSVKNLQDNEEKPTNLDEEEEKPLTPQQMMNRFIPFKEMPVGTVFELSGLRMKKMEYARHPDSEEGFFNAIQLGIENGYMWVKEDNSFRVVPANPRRSNNRNRRKKYSRGRNRSRNNSTNNQNNRSAPNKRNE